MAISKRAMGRCLTAAQPHADEFVRLIDEELAPARDVVRAYEHALRLWSQQNPSKATLGGVSPERTSVEHDHSAESRMILMGRELLLGGDLGSWSEPI